jgi:MFS family permease
LNLLTDSPKPVSAITLIKNPGIFRLWTAGATVITIRWLELVGLGIYVYETTGSPLMVSAVMFCRMVPMVMFGMVAGALGARFDRKWLSTVGLAVMTLTAIVLALLANAGLLNIVHIAIGAFIAGVYNSGEFPVRRSMVADIAGAENAGTAMALESISLNGSRLMGPLFAGFALETSGVAGLYWVTAVLYGIGLIAIATLAYSRPPRDGDKRASFVSDLLAGVHELRTNRMLAAALSVTVTMNFFFFPFSTMVPVIGKEQFDLGATMIGLLASAHGVGAFFGALVLSLRPQGNLVKIYCYGSIFSLITLVAFPLAPTFETSAFCMLLTGLGISGFSATQAAIVYLAARPSCRTQAMGLLTVCIGTGPFGTLHLGYMADLMGAQWAVFAMAVEGVIALGLSTLIWPELRGRKIETVDNPAGKAR